MSTVALEYQITGSADISAIQKTTAATTQLTAASSATAQNFNSASPALRGIEIQAKSSTQAVAEMNAKLNEGFGSKLTTAFINRFTSPEFLTGLAVAGAVAAKTLIDSMADKMIDRIRDRQKTVSDGFDKAESLRAKLNDASPAMRDTYRSEAFQRAAQAGQEAQLVGPTTLQGEGLLRIASVYENIANTSNEVLDALAARKKAAEDALADEERAAALGLEISDIEKKAADQLSLVSKAKLKAQLASQDPMERANALVAQYEQQAAELQAQQTAAINKAKDAGRPALIPDIKAGFESAREALFIEAQSQIDALKFDQTKPATNRTRQDFNSPSRTSDPLTKIGALGLGGIGTSRVPEDIARNTAETVALLKAIASRPQRPANTAGTFEE